MLNIFRPVRSRWARHCPGVSHYRPAYPLASRSFLGHARKVDASETASRPQHAVISTFDLFSIGGLHLRYLSQWLKFLQKR